MRLLGTLIVLGLLVGPSCSSDEGKAIGTEGGPCYGNGTCNRGLTCASQLCVALGDAGTDITRPKPDAAPPDAPSDTDQPEAASEDEGLPDVQPPDALTPTPGPWVTLPAGTFTMGSPSDEPCRGSDEDLHEVTISHAFEIQSTEVTQALFNLLMGYNPSKAVACDNCPVDTVSWFEAAAYCNAMSTSKGLTTCYECKTSGFCDQAATYPGDKLYTCPGYRLPTDAEWEYAYRAGTTTPYYNGANDPAKCDCQNDAVLNAIAWYCGSPGGSPGPVGQKMKNDWHLFDMAGSVFEWCHDWYTAKLGPSPVTDPVGLIGNYRVQRGGGADFEAHYTRAASRSWYAPEMSTAAMGFRCVRTIAP